MKIISVILLFVVVGVYIKSSVVKVNKHNTETYGDIKLPTNRTEFNFDTLSLDRGTRYNATIQQCDSSFIYTADGTYIDKELLKRNEIRYCALSWDLVDDQYRRDLRNESWAWRGDFKFGDTILIVSKSKPFINGMWVVHDVMSGRYRKSIDLLCHEDNMVPRLGVCKDIKILKPLL